MGLATLPIANGDIAETQHSGGLLDLILYPALVQERVGGQPNPFGWNALQKISPSAAESTRRPVAPRQRISPAPAVGAVSASARSREALAPRQSGPADR